MPLHAPPDVDRDAPPSPASAPAPTTRAPEPLRARDLSLALLGLLALGGAAALGMPPGSAALRLAPSVILVDLAALALTAPALIAVHQFLRLAASPEALAAGLGRALIHGGRVAGGLAVVVLFFSATTNLALPMLLAALGAVGVFTTATAGVELTRAERAAARVIAPSFSLLVFAWMALSWIIALRVGVDVGAWVLGYSRGLGA
jgi:hypothetical protein